jgi:LPPG:FO 2-phospho-L-lactate transferase
MKITVLTGGVGGAKLVLGLARAFPACELTALVNTGDDFRHLGLEISPDIDTLLYTLADRENPQQGWGRRDESWSFMEALRELGGPDWFQLGDGDLALHVVRTARLAAGDTLSAVTRAYADAWSIATRVMPMSDQPVRTRLQTDYGWLDFQNYFVERRCAPAVSEIQFAGAKEVVAAPGAKEAIMAADAVLIAPSNPFLSIDPILAVPGIQAALSATAAPVVAVSPIVAGKAVKGPTAKLMQELGLSVDNETIARHYAPFLSGLLVHADDPSPSDIPTAQTNTLMQTLDDRIRVARAAVDFARSLSLDPRG